MSDQRISRPVKMQPVHPGQVLKRILDGDENNPPVSVTAAALALGVSRQTLHRILAGTTPITVDTAQRIGIFAGNGPGLWLRMQSAYDLWHAEHSKAQPRVVPIDEARAASPGAAAARPMSKPAAKRSTKRPRARARA